MPDEGRERLTEMLIDELNCRHLLDLHVQKQEFDATAVWHDEPKPVEPSGSVIGKSLLAARLSRAFWSKAKVSNGMANDDDVRFMIQQELIEAQLFWQRTNTLLVVQVASVAAVTTLLASDKNPPKEIPISLCLLGLASCVAWWQITRMSRYYGDVWLRDARRIAELDPSLKQKYWLSLGFREEFAKRRDSENTQTDSNSAEESPGRAFLDLRRPSGPSATYCVYFLTALFGSIWAGLIVWSVSKP